MKGVEAPNPEGLPLSKISAYTVDRGVARVA
jgi:hypothetical protein